MGTKVHCNSYFPRYYSMRDLNEDANSGYWPLSYDKKNSESTLYYNTLPRENCTDGFFEYDKEVLKQKMIEHETIFRNQVYELHRLYKIQRDLMDELKRKELHRYPMPPHELKRKELHRYPIPVEASQSSPFSSQTPSEEARQMWHNSQLPLVNSINSRLSVSGVDKKLSPLNSIIGSSKQATQNGDSMESKPKKLRRRMFDLQLPADEYIDSDEGEGEQFEEEKTSEVSMEVTGTSVKEVKPSLGNVGNTFCKGDGSRSNSCMQSHSNLADLNEPILTASDPVDFLGPFTYHRAIQECHQLAKPNSDILGLPRDFFPNTQRARDVVTCSNTVHLENKGKQWEWLPYNPETGQSRTNLNSFTQGFCPEKSPMPSGPIKVELERGHGHPAFLLSDQSKRETWRERGVSILDISGRNRDLSTYNSSGSTGASCLHSTYQGVHWSDGQNSASSSVASWRKPFTQNPMTVQALPDFKAPSALSKSSKISDECPRLIGDNWHLNGNPMSFRSFGSEVSYQNGFSHGTQSGSKSLEVRFPSAGFDYLNCSVNHGSATKHLENHGTAEHFKGLNCIDVKSTKNINLNMVVPNGSGDGVVYQRDLLIIDGEDDQSGGLPWLRTKPSCNIGPANEREGSIKMGSSSLQDYPQQFSNYVVTEKFEVGDSSSCKKILGFPIFGKPHISKDPSSSFSFSSNCCKSDVENIGIVPNPGKKLCREKLSVEKGLENNNLGGFKYHINLNSCANEDETPLTVEIDLEAPVIPETEGIPCGEESLLLQPIELKGMDQQEQQMRAAAEAIIAISLSSIHSHPKNSIYHSSEASLNDYLSWFAEVVSSAMDDLESEVGVVLRGKSGGGDHEESSSDSDSFESMTLKLTETKVEEYWCKTPVPENQEEETGVTTLSSRPRKGHARRGRQRRDFQKDILPGLASLSRHEVTEDLQTIGGLMRANGRPWQTGSARRSAARNGWAGGRRCLRDPFTSVTVSTVCSRPRQQFNNSELGLDERRLTGWGKTARRPRRQRCLASNLSLISLTQV